MWNHHAMSKPPQRTSTQLITQHRLNWKNRWKHFGQRRRAPCAVSSHFSDIQQTLRAAAVDEEQLKRQLDEMRNYFTTATTQQDPHLFLESLTRAHEDFTFGLTTNTPARMLERLHAAQAYRGHRHCR
jgi:hypothetical protein